MKQLINSGFLLPEALIAFPSAAMGAPVAGRSQISELTAQVTDIAPC